MVMMLVVVMVVVVDILLQMPLSQNTYQSQQTNTKNQRQWHLRFCRSEYPLPGFDIANSDFQGIYIAFIHQVYLIE
jgi:hypothetical protein